MAHNDWIRPLGVWPLFTILTSNVMHLFDERQMQSINGDLGGTWAPTSTITLGNGAGNTLAVRVTGGFQADDAAITITGGKALHVLSGGTLLMDLGSTTTLSGAVGLNNVMTVGGALGQILVNNGKAINVHGQVNILSDGVINVSSGGFINLASGATIACTSGSLLSGVLRTTGAFSSVTIAALTGLFIEGGFTISSGGLGTIASGGRINVADGGELRVQSSGLVKFQAGSELLIEADASFLVQATTVRSAPEVLSDDAYVALRTTQASTGADTTFDARLWDWIRIHTLLPTGRTYDLDHADFLSFPNGIKVTFQRAGNSDLNGATIVVNGNPAFTFHGGGTATRTASVTFIKFGGLWWIDSWSGRYGVDGSPLI